MHSASVIARTALEHLHFMTGISLSTLRGMGRYLSETPGDAWPKGIRGRGGSLNVYPHHLASMWCALVQGSVRNATEEAQTLGALRTYSNAVPDAPIIAADLGQTITPAQFDPAALDFMMSWQDVMRRSSLREAMTWLIDTLSDTEHPVVHLLKGQEMALFITMRKSLAGGLRVEIDFTHYTKDILIVRGQLAIFDDLDPGKPFDPERMRYMQTGKKETCSFESGFFLVLAEIWADTKAQLVDAETPSGSDPEGKEPPSSPNEGGSEALEESRVKKLHPKPYRTTLHRRPDRKAKSGVRATANSAWAIPAQPERSHDVHRHESA